MLAQVVLIIALLLLFIGVIMVLLDAFKESFFWGLLVLLLPPIFVPVYSFVKWNKSQARNGFAMAFVGLFMAAIGVYGGGLLGFPGVIDNEMASNLPSANPDDQPLPNEEAAANVKLDDPESYDPMLSTDKDRFSSNEIDPLAPKEDKSVNSSSSKVSVSNVSLENINAAVGAIIELTMNDGSRHTGILTSTTENTVFIEQYAGAGTIEYEYKKNKIESVVRYTRPGK